MMPLTAVARCFDRESSSERAGSVERRAWMARSQVRKLEKRMSSASEVKRIS